MQPNHMPDSCFKNRENLIEEIKDNVHGGACAHTANFSLAEMQPVHEEIVINKKLSKKLV